MKRVTSSPSDSPDAPLQLTAQSECPPPEADLACASRARGWWRESKMARMRASAQRLDFAERSSASHPTLR